MTPVTTFNTEASLTQDHIELVADLTDQPAGGVSALLSPASTGLTQQQQQQLIAGFIALTLLLADCESRKSPSAPSPQPHSVE